MKLLSIQALAHSSSVPSLLLLDCVTSAHHHGSLQMTGLFCMCFWQIVRTALAQHEEYQDICTVDGTGRWIDALTVVTSLVSILQDRS